MSPLYLSGGKLLVRNGSLAFDSKCCCEKYFCYKSVDPYIGCPAGCPGPNSGYYYFTAADEENILNDINVGGISVVFTRIDANTFESIDYYPSITMKKEEGRGPVPKNTSCGDYALNCNCPSATGYWYITGWDLGSPSGAVVLNNPNCTDGSLGLARCFRSLSILDFPPPDLPTCFPRAWNEGSRSGKVALYVSYCAGSNPVKVKEIDWNMWSVYCSNAPACIDMSQEFSLDPGSLLPLEIESSYYTSSCVQPSGGMPIEWSESRCCVPSYSECIQCFIDAGIGIGVSDNPWQPPTVNNGVRFVGAGDWYNWNNWVDSSGNSPAIAEANWNKTIEGTVFASRHGVPLLLGSDQITLTGDMQISFECDNMIIDGGSIGSAGEINCGERSLNTRIDTFLFKNSGEALITNGPFLTGSGKFTNNSKNYGRIMGNVIFESGSKNIYLTGDHEIIGDVIFENTTENDGIVRGNTIFKGNAKNTANGLIYVPATTGTAIFEGLSENLGLIEDAGVGGGNTIFKNSAKNMAGATIRTYTTFEGSSENYGTIEGDALFKNSAKNYGHVTGTATFQNSACNSGTAGTFDPDPPPAC